MVVKFFYRFQGVLQNVQELFVYGKIKITTCSAIGGIVMWIMIIITVCTLLLALQLVNSNPKTALLVSALVPCTLFYYLGKEGYKEAFLFTFILYFAAVNIMFIRQNINNG
ncbi:hypothetical protein MUN89_05220 [Halobacillus salinarum]|uniref:Uncharacterized protein n=1 Tax=Halobacillus salinarum TaxID=2932257 RepID=A0ABY4EMG2_9BACI|nr:hypothetical protein [Halobacillus salinarum]UOQ45349.1 hypothetical protein MUN89_05220 [Halobacillus salinarum]